MPCAINVPYALRRYELNRAFSIPLPKCFRAGVVSGKWLIGKRMLVKLGIESEPTLNQ